MNDDAGGRKPPLVDRIDREEAMRLLGEAARAAGAAYAPYSGLSVGAALLAGDGHGDGRVGGQGRTFTGCNVENASYGLSICAERVAVFKAVSEGAREFRAIAIAVAVAAGDGPDAGDGRAVRAVPPCGACCQVLAEFNPGMRVILPGGPGAGGEPVVSTLDRLLSAPFRPGHLAAAPEAPRAPEAGAGPGVGEGSP